MTGKKHYLVLLFLSLFVLAAGAEANSYWQRISQGFDNRAFVYEQRLEKDTERVEIRASIPQIKGTLNEVWEREVNDRILECVETFLQEVEEAAELAPAESFAFPYAGYVNYEVTLNQGGLLSLTLTFYQYTGGAHGMTYLEGINLDLTTGKTLTFDEVLGSPQERELLVAVINDRLAEDPQWFFIDKFDEFMIGEEQGFYLQPAGIVVYFPLYEIAPYAAGIQKFVVPLQ